MSFKPTSPVFGPWAIAMAAVDSRTRPTTISRSWRRTCWMAARVASQTGFQHTTCIVDPPLGRAGMTEVQARQSGRRVLMAKRAMTRVGRAIEKGETQGFMKILVDGDSKEILGAAILGTGGDEAIHCILDVMYAKKPYTVIQR